MTRRSFLSRAVAFCVALLVFSTPVQAAEIRVASSGGFAAAYQSLAPRFERETGNTLVLIRGPSMGDTPEAVPARLRRGEPIDVVIMVGYALGKLISEGKVLPDSRVDLARSGIGLAVRAGAPKPDISTVDALRRTLLAAKSIAYSDSASGVYVSRELFKHLGIADQVATKARMIPAEPVGEVIARGEAEIGFQQISELKPVHGIEIVGPLPAEVQQYTVFSAGIVAGTREPDRAKALIGFLAAPDAAPAIAESGMEPLTRPPAAPKAAVDEPLILKDMGSFHVGGRLVEISGRPVREVLFTPGGVPAKVDPNGTYQTGQMYVQYFIPENQRGAVPLLLWHGGGLTGVTYETTPDGRPGWLNWFLRKGWAVYNSDAVERGRAGWSMYPDIFPGEPVFLTTANPWERFRIGAGPGSFDQDPSKRKQLPGSQFPAEGYDNFVKQNVPRWTTTDPMIIDAYVAEVDRVCPCVILFHSQAGQFGFKVAQARPDKVKALVAVEPAGVGDPAKAAALKDIPVLMVFGDYIDQDSRWPKIRQNALEFGEAVKAAGGSIDVVDLPNIGIKGNSHMLMMDRNNAEVAAVIQDWLVRRGLYRW